MVPKLAHIAATAADWTSLESTDVRTSLACVGFRMQIGT